MLKVRQLQLCALFDSNSCIIKCKWVRGLLSLTYVSGRLKSLQGNLTHKSLIQLLGITKIHVQEKTSLIQRILLKLRIKDVIMWTIPAGAQNVWTILQLYLNRFTPQKRKCGRFFLSLSAVRYLPPITYQQANHLSHWPRAFWHSLVRQVTVMELGVGRTRPTRGIHRSQSDQCVC